MKVLFLSALLASLILSVLAFFGPGWIGGQSRLTTALVQIAIGVLVLFLRMLILAPVAVAVHRFILLGEHTPGIISLRPSYTRRFALWLCVSALAIFAVLVVGASLSLSFVLGAFGEMLFFISVVAVIACSIFSALVFPSIAIAEPSSGWRDRLKASWRRMDGHFWLFLGLSVVTVLPIVFVELLLLGSLGAVKLIVLHDFSHEGLLDFAMQAATDLANVFLAMLGAAVASRFYARFRDQDVGVVGQPG